MIPMEQIGLKKIGQVTNRKIMNAREEGDVETLNGWKNGKRQVE